MVTFAIQSHSESGVIFPFAVANVSTKKGPIVSGRSNRAITNELGLQECFMMIHYEISTLVIMKTISCWNEDERWNFMLSHSQGYHSG